MIPTYAVDTSVAVPLASKAHPLQAAASSWARGKELWLSGHAAIETYSVLTRLPRDPLSPRDALKVLNDQFAGSLEFGDTTWIECVS